VGSREGREEDAFSGSGPTNGDLGLTAQERDASRVILHERGQRASAGRGKGGEVLLIGIDREGVAVIQARKSCRILTLYLEPMVAGKAALRTRSNS
jgi:hypothetical protein